MTRIGVMGVGRPWRLKFERGSHCSKVAALRLSVAQEPQKIAGLKGEIAKGLLPW